MHHQAANLPASARQFRDSRGRDWRVYERQKEELVRGSVTMLIFESDADLRIVRDYPANWRELEPEVLEYLSWPA